MNHDTSLPVPLSDDDYELPTASSFIESLFEQFDPAIDEVGESMTYLNVLSVDLPIEMALREVDGTTVVAMSPPHTTHRNLGVSGTAPNPDDAEIKPIMTTRTEPWNLESFLDSLILELDKAQDTLSVKGITRKLTYTVQDVALDLQIFPHFDSGKVQFSAAQPGESGSSKLSIKLGSITDRQIRETTRDPFKVDDVAIETIDELDDETKDNLQRKGIHTASDLERPGAAQRRRGESRERQSRYGQELQVACQPD